MGEKERKLLHKQLIVAHNENELEELTDKKNEIMIISMFSQCKEDVNILQRNKTRNE